jgi:hypothetical protein
VNDETPPPPIAGNSNIILLQTLRYLVYLTKYLEVHLLAIRFQFDGETWEADTPEEAIALRHKLEYSTRFGPDPHKKMDEMERFWTPDRFMDVIEGIGELQKKLLLEVRRKPGITSDELVTALEMKSEVALAGVLSGLSKQLKKLGIEPSSVFVIRVDWTGKSKTRSFLLDDFFIGAGTEQNWPDAWEEAIPVNEFGSRPLIGDDSEVGD